MNINRIEDVYLASNEKYIDLYDFFMKLDIPQFDILSTRLSINHKIFRIRDYSNIREIKSKADVQHSPIPSTGFSRIGKPNETWFYASDDKNTSILEMFPSWSTKFRFAKIIKIIIGVWQVKKEVTIFIIPDFSNMNEVCNKLDLDSHYSDKEFWTYICRKFKTTTLEDKYIYEFTSAFANALIDRAKNAGITIEGFFYPSVQNPIKSNVALLPSVVISEKIDLIGIYKTKILKGLFHKNTENQMYYRFFKSKKGNYDNSQNQITFQNNRF